MHACTSEFERICFAAVHKYDRVQKRFEKAEMVSFENGEITIKINNMCFVDWTDGNYVSSDSFFTYKKD